VGAAALFGLGRRASLGNRHGYEVAVFCGRGRSCLGSVGLLFRRARWLLLRKTGSLTTPFLPSRRQPMKQSAVCSPIRLALLSTGCYLRIRSMGECRLFKCRSQRFVDALAFLAFCPMRGSDGPKLVFERSLLLVLKGSVAARSKAPLVCTSVGPAIELPTELPVVELPVVELPVEPPEAPPAPPPEPPPPPPLCANASVELRAIAIA